ncbi:MAG: hypothetical protein R3E12_18450 [Candidatus Eisenbacteria bacterium]
MSTAARSRYGSRAVRTISILVLIAAATTRLAIAGPNAGGTLVIHADPDVVYSPDIEYCGFGTLPASCAEVNTRVDGTATTTWHVFAAFPENSHPRLAGVAWGVTYDPDRVVVADWGGCGDFELPNSGWPAPGEGTAVTWGVAQTATFTEIYWFAGYVYAAEATSFDLTLHPQQGGSFVGRQRPPGSLDPIADFGELGFNGNPGYLPCPDPLPEEERALLPGWDLPG